MAVLGDINVIINAANKIIMIHLPEYSESNNRKQYINDEFLYVGTNIYLIQHSDLPQMLVPYVKMEFSHF